MTFSPTEGETGWRAVSSKMQRKSRPGPGFNQGESTGEASCTVPGIRAVPMWCLKSHAAGHWTESGSLPSPADPRDPASSPSSPIPTVTLRPIQPLPGPRRTGLEAICVGSDCNLGPCGPQSIVAFAQRQAEIARRAAQEMSSGPGRGQRWAPASPSRRPAATARRGYFFI